MSATVLCVPNVSEGRDRAVIDRIAGAVSATPGAALLDVDSGADTNRTVITFAGSPQAVADAAFGVIAAAVELIDMAPHTGSHARMGAADVVPFVPVADVTMADCVALARAVGKRAAEELAIPVYLYGHAASRPERVKLADIRRGEYEALEAKLADPDFAPDFGPACFNPRSGATVIGARDFLLAYNVNLNTADVAVAKTVAAAIRESRSAGKLPHCQAAGWVVEAFGCAQVTMNLSNHAETGLHTAFEAVRDQARSLGADVTGSELIGLAPKQALLDAGRFYLTGDADEADLIAAAADSLGLTDKTPFDPALKIVEYRVADVLRSADG